MRQVSGPSAATAPAHDPGRCVTGRQVALHRNGPPAGGNNIGDQFIGFVLRGIVVNRHRPAIAGQVQRHLPANALRCTGYQAPSRSSLYPCFAYYLIVFKVLQHYGCARDLWCFSKRE